MDNKALQQAFDEMVADYKAGSRFTDNDIRATARRYGVEATELYVKFEAWKEQQS